MKLVCVFILTFLWLSVAADPISMNTIHGTEILGLSNTVCNTCGLRTHTVRSRLQCSVACSEDSDCMSFGYAKKERECMLHWCSPQAVDCAVDIPGVKYYTVVKRNQPGYTYADVISGWYKIHTSRENWAAAHDICRKEGGHLLSIKSQDIEDWISQILGDPAYASKQYWIDGNDVTVEGEWRFHDGSEIVWFSWKSRPNGMKIQNCIGLNSRYSSKWDDEICTKPFRFICQVDGI